MKSLKCVSNLTVSDFYHPQTKFPKVMFSQVSVCPMGVLGGSLSRGVSVWGYLCPGGLCPGGLCPGGLCQGGLWHGDSPQTVTSGRYISYWNAFLLYHTFYNISSSSTSRLKKITGGFLLLKAKSAENASIDSDIKDTIVAVVSKKVGGEVVKPISTRGHCEGSGCAVVPAN